MPKVSLLYIDDAVVGPHLDLLRRICSPNSRSRPHITVRFYDRLQAEEEDLQTKVAYIDLIGVGVFSGPSSAGTKRYTVYLRCGSETLLSLEHKPHFPASELHITIADGTTRDIAERLVRALRSIKWDIRVPLPPESRLSLVDIRRPSAGRSNRFRSYSARLNDIFRAATDTHLEMEYLARADWTTRLRLVKAVCRHLRDETVDFERIPKFKKLRTRGGIAAQDSAESQEIHVTPPELARSITKFALSLITDNAPIHFGDPAVGNGTFFAALRQLVPGERIASAIGVEINSHQATVAATRWAHAGLEVRTGDYRHMERLPPRNFILANPPYLRHQKILSKHKWALRERASVILGKHISARSGEYVYFLILSHCWLTDKGLAAWLLPSEFMQTAYGSAVRYYLTHNVQLIRVHQFSPNDPKFETVQVMPSVVVFRKASPDSGVSVHITRGGSLEEPLRSNIVPIAELKMANRWFSEIPKDDAATRSLFRIKHLFTVKRGIATGANDFFIRKRDEARDLGIPTRAVRPILPKVRALTSDIVNDAGDGYPAVWPQLAVIDCDWPIQQIIKRHPRFYAYLQSAYDADIVNGRLVSARKPWYRQERRGVAAFLCTYMGRGHEGGPALRFIWNKSQAIATNTYLMLYPLPAVERAMCESHEFSEKLFALLRTTASFSLAHHSRVYAGGLRKIEPSELLEAELPSVPDWLRAVLDPTLLEV